MQTNKRFNSVDLFEMGVRSDNSYTELLISLIKIGAWGGVVVKALRY